MPSGSALGLYVVAALVLLVIPGPSVLYIIAQSIEHGRQGGLVAVLGIHVGSVVHIAAAALGISAIVASSATAFDVLRYAGAAYLIALGARRLLSRASDLPERRASTELDRVFRRGIIVNVLNPKTAVFFLAFLPQFIDPGGSVPLQIVALGFIFIGLGLFSDSTWALLGGTAGEWLRSRPSAVAGGRYASGAVYIGLGVATAISGSHRSSS